MTNCKNCGAPLLKNGDCEYCGTKAIEQCRSGLEITESKIRCWVDAPSIGRVVAPAVTETVMFADDKPIYVE